MEKQLEKVKEAVRADFTRRGIPGYATKKKLRELVETQDTGGFVHGTGKRKSPEQREWEKSRGLLERWEKYEGQLLTIGTRRNSCSKTDPDATFMRMKEAVSYTHLSKAISVVKNTAAPKMEPMARDHFFSRP